MLFNHMYVYLDEKDNRVYICIYMKRTILSKRVILLYSCTCSLNMLEDLSLRTQTYQTRSLIPQDILNATVKQRKTFTELVASAANLQLVDIPGWAGLGGVRYIPDLLATNEPLSDVSKEDINSLNIHLVQQLKASDSAFSLGKSVGGDNCCFTSHKGMHSYICWVC